VAAAASLAAAGAGRWRRRAARRDAASPGSVLAHTSRRARNLEVARLGLRVGAGAASVKARQVFADAGRREALQSELELRTAEEVAATLGHLKGALMKIGQMASYLDEGLPEPLRLALTQLQQDAPPMSADLAAQVVAEELGAAPEEVFAEWDPVPIAAASIGQVHRAITRDERAVAVKVQYPGVAEAIEADLGNADLLFGSLKMAFPGLEPGPLVAELRARIVEELDYHHEAANQELFARWYAGHPFLHVPAVVHELSTRRVLTTELATGARFEEVLGWSQEERDLAGEALFRFVFGSLYRLHAFNGDPHPGNYLFHPGGRVTFLDFGLTRRFSQAEIDVFQSMIRTMVVERDPAAFRRIVEQAGLLRAGAPVSTEEVGEYFAHFYASVQEDAPVTWTPEYASATVRRTFASGHPVSRHTNVPASFVIIQRINLGLYALLGRLAAHGNWRRIAEELWPFVQAPPSTELGRAEARWRDLRHPAGDP